MLCMSMIRTIVAKLEKLQLRLIRLSSTMSSKLAINVTQI